MTQVERIGGMLYSVTIVVLGGLACTVTGGEDVRNVSIHGAGASFPSQVYQSWLVQFASFRSKHVSLNLDYRSVGSGTGKAMVKGETDEYIDYAGSDSLLNDADNEQHPDLRMFPTMAG